MDSLTIRRPDDLHCHFRSGDLLREVLPQTARYAGRGLAMPNTRPRAILTAEDVVWYRGEIEKVLETMSPRPNFTPLMSIEIRDTTTPAMIHEAKEAGAVAGKIYPVGVTTNSDHGMSFNFVSVHNVFQAMQDAGMLLLLHGEVPGENINTQDREEKFLPLIFGIAGAFPKLRIVMEHVSSAAAVSAVAWATRSNIAATVTAHHLCLTLNDVVDGRIRPHNGCMPMPKKFEDRDALIHAATGGNPRFFLGSDTAPHPRENKECAEGSCGVYTAPVLLPVLAEVFEKAGALEKLENFVSGFGARFYGLEPNTDTVTLVREPWTVPEQIGSVVPFKAGQTLRWRLRE